MQPFVAAATTALEDLLGSPVFVLGESLAKIIDNDTVEAVTKFIKALPVSSRQEVVGHAFCISHKATIEKIQAILVLCPALLQHSGLAVHLLDREDYQALETLYQQGWRATSEITEEWEQFVAVNLDDEDEEQRQKLQALDSRVREWLSAHQ